MFRREKSLMLFGLDADRYSLKGVWLFLFVYLGATLFAAITTAPAYWFVEWVHSISPSDTTRWLLGKDMDVYFDRMRWVPIIVGLPWVLSKCGLLSASNLGIRLSLSSLKTAGRYFLLGLVLAGTIFSLQYLFADVSAKGGISGGDLIRILVNAILGGAIIGFLEELVFRGLIMRTIYTAATPWAAVLLSSLFFAYKHFKVPDSVWSHLPGGLHNPSWDIGFFIAYYDAIGISENFAPVNFASLAMFGMVLCMVYIRTKTLLAPVALHCALVFMIQAYRSIFDIGQCEAMKYFGNAGMTNGIVPLTLLTLIFVWLVYSQKKSESGGSDTA